MKDFKFIYLCLMLFFSPFLFNSCSNDDDTETPNSQDFDICDIFTIYDIQIEDAGGGKNAGKATVSYSNTNQLITITIVENSSLPALQFAIENANVQGKILILSDKKAEARFFKTDKINLTGKALDSTGKNYSFTGIESSDKKDDIEKPAFCDMSDMYTTYIGSISTNQNEVFERVKIQVTRQGNTMIIKPVEHTSLATVKINISDFKSKNGCLEYEKSDESVYFCKQEQGIACGLTTKGTNGYSFLGATWDPFSK